MNHSFRIAYEAKFQASFFRDIPLDFGHRFPGTSLLVWQRNKNNIEWVFIDLAILAGVEFIRFYGDLWRFQTLSRLTVLEAEEDETDSG